MNPTARLATDPATAGSDRHHTGAVAGTDTGPRPGAGSGALAGRRRGRLLAIPISALVGLFLLVMYGSAFATTGHGFAGGFGGPGPEEGKFSPGPVGVAVGVSGEVFVTDSGVDPVTGTPNPRVQRFDPSGAFQAIIAINNAEYQQPGAIAVDSSLAGGVYVSVTNTVNGVPEVAKYSAAGLFEHVLNPEGSETSINYGVVAVDPGDGTVYTTATNPNTGGQLIDSFDQGTGAFIASFNGESGSPDGAFQCPGALAVDSTHHVYVLDSCKGRVDKYSSAGAYEASVDDGSRGAPQKVSTDPSSGEVFVAEAGPSGPQVTHYSAGGAAAIQTFATPNAGAIAAGPDSTLYATDGTTTTVDRYTAFEGPTVASEDASGLETRSATLNGTVNAENIASKYHYEYGLDNTYGKTSETFDAGSGSTANAAPATVEGLIPNTTYHYRIVGTNASGQIVGADKELTTLAAPPVVDGSPAFVTAITSTGARVHGSVNPEHSLTRFLVEYGTTTAYGSSTPEGGAEVGEQSVDTPVVTNLSGLEPGTLYHYRLSAEDGVEGAQTGADGTFITAPGTPAGGSETTTHRATLTGTIDPHGEATKYHFNYGPSTEYGASTPEVDGGSGEGEQQVGEQIAGLTPGSTYHVQVVAVSGGITRTGADGTFTTAVAPGAAVNDPTAVTSSSATLEGEADTHGLTGSYHFEITALDGSYDASTPETALAAVTGTQGVSAPASGLAAGETFQARLVVSSNEASSYSSHVTFSTPALPPAGFPTPPAPASVYGCTAPKLNPVNGKIKPGSTITVTGSDLGMAGSVLLGEETLLPTNWSAGAFTIEIPGDAVGTLGLTVNCGVASNTVAIATTSAPVNTFTITKHTVKGTTATLSVAVPGAGTLQSSSARTKGTTAKVTAAGTQTVQVKLTRAGAKALAKAKRKHLTVKVALKFTPAGGAPGSQTVSLTFKGKGKGGH